MEWSRQQSEALSRVSRWKSTCGNPGADPVFMLGGYAGTGKTTLAKHFAEGERAVFFAAFTGKAAHVLKRSGAPNVSTVHQLIYLSVDRCRSKLVELEAKLSNLLLMPETPDLVLQADTVRRSIEEEKQNLKRPLWKLNTDSPLKDASLLVVDEYSMIDQKMGEDLLSFGCPILALGDPGQLPPVFGSGYFSRQPDYMLTEIHRQARDNPIIGMATTVREGGILTCGTYGDSQVIAMGDLGREGLARLVMGADQLLVGRNKTRRASNSRVRTLLERSGVYPVEGDRLVCLRNSHTAGLLNGQIWNVQGSVIPASPEEFLTLHLTNEDGESVVCDVHRNHFDGTHEDLDPWTRLSAQEFDYGYALTVHKAQGSQWDSVVLLDEWTQASRRQWLYTAITRASKTIQVIQM